MRIQCPLNQRSIEIIDEYIDAGADEFYFGYRNALSMDNDCLNRRFGRLTNFDSMNDALDAVMRIKRREKKAFIALNELFYPSEWHDALIEEIRRFADSGADGFIISDLNILIKLKEINSDYFIVLSSTAHILNTHSVRFYDRFGIGRLILPRQLSVNEISAMLEDDKNRKFELIIMNEECPQLEGLCSYSHIPGNDSLNICYQALVFNKLPTGFGYVVDSCGACSIYSFKDHPELVLKIAGRGMTADWTLKDILFIRRAVSFLNKCESAHDFAVACAEEHFRIFRDRCRKKCYYYVDYRPGDDVTGGEAPSEIIQGGVKYLSSLPYPLLT
jgi:hypothetical protein